MDVLQCWEPHSALFPFALPTILEFELIAFMCSISELFGQHAKHSFSMDLVTCGNNKPIQCVMDFVRFLHRWKLMHCTVAVNFNGPNGLFPPLHLLYLFCCITSNHHRQFHEVSAVLSCYMLIHLLSVGRICTYFADYAKEQFLGYAVSNLSNVWLIGLV